MFGGGKRLTESYGRRIREDQQKKIASSFNRYEEPYERRKEKEGNRKRRRGEKEEKEEKEEEQEKEEGDEES